MRRSISYAFCLALAGLVASPGSGADGPLQPDCAQPVRPPDKTDTVVWNHFVDQVGVYRSCMNAFITANHAAADRYRAAANAATEEWNEFVHSSLNVPEDFPWPPPERSHPGR